ncbi:MAG: YfcE family phosphodiesterase, partial [Anaerovorax sp.]
SDTHGEVAMAETICRNSKEPFDLMLHLGDFQKDGIQIGEAVGLPVIAVKGNCDGSLSSSDYEILEVEFGKIYLAHGHFDHVNYDYKQIQYKAQSLDCKAAIFGHTHKGIFVEENGFYWLNPGSLSRPLDGKGRSYGVITTDEKGMTGTILYL